MFDNDPAHSCPDATHAYLPQWELILRAYRMFRIVTRCQPFGYLVTVANESSGHTDMRSHSSSAAR